ncbi:hypothetical protein GCM10009117_21660 [Gangjinia marincola]|uniref:Uncharacterized protein n=1 Tax=Gangjinia marincola TaxID=578463 RepID=A0ABP3XUE6_9FLAO
MIDFTSSGLTHSYSGDKEESNPFRVGKLVTSPSFGMMYINLKTMQVEFEMRGLENIVFENLKIDYSVTSTVKK